MDGVKHLILSTGFAVRSLIQEPPKASTLGGKLAEASVPVTLDPCRSCPNPCDVDIDGADNGGFATDEMDPHSRYAHEEWPTKFFDVDFASDMLGTVKPYYRQVVISTGKSDWYKEVTEAKDTLALFLNDVHNSKQQSSSFPPRGSSKAPETLPGILSPESSNRLGILNGSHRTTSDDPKEETVLVFPDYKLVTNVDSSIKGAEAFWEDALSPAAGRAGCRNQQGSMRSWALPYQAVLMLCSHKRRDARCAIAAPVLKKAITTSLESCGWEVHDQLDEHMDDPPFEEVAGNDETREASISQRLKSLGEPKNEPKRALVLYISHTGGHKYAGNVIIYFPNGTGVWYGRVSSHEVGAVTKTVTDGKIYPTLLRGGINLQKQKGKTLLDW